MRIEGLGGERRMVHGIKHTALFTSHAPWVQWVSTLGSLENLSFCRILKIGKTGFGDVLYNVYRGWGDRGKAI